MPKMTNKKSPFRQATGKKANKRGKYAEKLALFLMRLKGYHLIQKNFKVKQGMGVSEVDLILRKHKTLIFTEVKQRQHIENLPFAVTDEMKNRITKAARLYLAQHPEYTLFDVRFDVILIRLPFSFKHIKNAWYENWYS